MTDGKVNLLGNLEITHVDVSGSQRVLINNPDTDGFIRLSNNKLSRLTLQTQALIYMVSLLQRITQILEEI